MNKEIEWREVIRNEKINAKITTTRNIVEVIKDYGIEKGIDLVELINRIKEL